MTSKTPKLPNYVWWPVWPCLDRNLRPVSKRCMQQGSFFSPLALVEVQNCCTQQYDSATCLFISMPPLQDCCSKRNVRKVVQHMRRPWLPSLGKKLACPAARESVTQLLVATQPFFQGLHHRGKVSAHTLPKAVKIWDIMWWRACYEELV